MQVTKKNDIIKSCMIVYPPDKHRITVNHGMKDGKEVVACSFTHNGDLYTQTTEKENLAQVLEIGKMIFFEAASGRKLQDIKNKEASMIYFEEQKTFFNNIEIVEL